jgi:plastocyanin
MPFIGVAALTMIALVVPSAVATDGPRVQATVSFGQWQTDPPLDRFLIPNQREHNNHVLLPREVTIKEGGAVNFIISGFHLPTIYDDGTQPGDINTTLVVPPPPVALINDPNNRIFRGTDPRPLLQDRVESVTFHKPGTYLVICAVHPHFVNDGMFGFVKVRARDDD